MSTSQLSISFTEVEAIDRTTDLIHDLMIQTRIGSPKFNILQQVMDKMEGADKVEAHGRTVGFINSRLGHSKYGSARFRTLQRILEALNLDSPDVPDTPNRKIWTDDMVTMAFNLRAEATV